MSKKSKTIKIDKPIGIYDPDGLNINPLTNKPYENIYSHIKKTIDGEILPATYANLAKIWKTKLVYLHKDQILHSIQNNQVTLAKAGTGVGKTVLIPKIALHAFGYNKKVITTIPKKVITRSTAEFAAQCLDVKIGEEVGYYFKGDNKMDDEKTKLIFTTTGSIISKITGSDPYLKDYSCVIIDEAHERTVQTDLLLLLLKKALLVRKDLKVVIMSATINLEVFRNYFPEKDFTFNEVDAGEHTTYEITDYWLDKRPKPNEWKEIAVKRIIHILSNSEFGDILVFIRASSDGKSICENLNRTIKTLNIKLKPFCTVLAGNSSKEEEELATNEHKYKELRNDNDNEYTRKIVMATNVAESSLTVDGVVYVIDSGLEYEESYDPKKMSRGLTEEFIAQSSMKQRRGRGGRTKPGVCYHLYTEEDSKKFNEYPIPSIQKTDLTSDFLDLMKLDYIKNIKDLKDFYNEFISPPSNDFIQSSLNTLEALQAITSVDNTGTITELGYILSKFRAIKPQFGKALLSSYYHKCSREVSDIIALLITADGMISNVFFDFRENVKSKQFKKRKELYIQAKKEFSHSYGDVFTLHKIYTKLNEKENQLKEKYREKEAIKQLDRYSKKKSVKLTNVSKKTTTKKSGVSQKKSIKIMKSFNIKTPSIKKSIKDTLKGGENESIKASSKKTSSQKASVKKASVKKASSQKASVKKTSFNKENNINILVNKEMKKWCYDHFINYNKLKRCKQLSKKIHFDTKNIFKKKKRHKTTVELFDNENIQVLKDQLTQDGGNLRELHTFFDYDIDYNMEKDDLVLLALIDGLFINVARNNGNVYNTCFPIQKVKAKINQSSLITSKPDIVFYDELFMFNKGSDVLKLNMVNLIPEHLKKNVIEKYEIIQKCRQIKSEKRHSKKRRKFNYKQRKKSKFYRKKKK
jgi:HrpA-like RNA helicase